MEICSIEHCEKPICAKGMCSSHYRLNLKYGSPFIRQRRKVGEGTINDSGYKLHRRNGKDFREHILIAERVLGKSLPQGAVVHHIDHNRLNNKTNNLVICPDSAYHILIHKRERAYDSCGYANWLKCSYCKTYDDPQKLIIRIKEQPRKMEAYHQRCRSNYEYRRRRK